VSSQFFDTKTSQTPGVLTAIRSMSLRAMGKAAKSFENLFSEAEGDSDDDFLFDHPLASLLDEDSSVKRSDGPRLQSSVSAPLALMQSVSARAARRARENLRLVEEDSVRTPGLFSIVRSVSRRM